MSFEANETSYFSETEEAELKQALAAMTDEELAAVAKFHGQHLVLIATEQVRRDLDG